MRRWFYTLLITLTLGLAVGCGSKSNSGNTPAPAPAPADPTVPPACSSTVTKDCTPQTPAQTFYKSAYGDIQFSNFEEFKSIRKKYLGCDPYNSISLWGLNLGGNWGNTSCDSYGDVALRFTILGDNVSVDMYFFCTDWTCGNTYYSRNLFSTKIAPINNNTGFEFSGTVYNDAYRFRIENQDLKGSINVKVELKKYLLNNPSGSQFVNIGIVQAQDVQ